MKESCPDISQKSKPWNLYVVTEISYQRNVFLIKTLALERLKLYKGRCWECNFRDAFMRSMARVLTAKFVFDLGREEGMQHQVET
jgi:hypothetical protein